MTGTIRLGKGVRPETESEESEEPMTEELSFPDRSDRTLFAVDSQPAFLFQKLYH
jgi:hypothetical protein